MTEVKTAISLLADTPGEYGVVCLDAPVQVLSQRHPLLGQRQKMTTLRSLRRRRLRIRPLPTILVTTTLMRDILTGSICASCVVVRSSSPRKTLRRANSKGYEIVARHQFSHPLGHGVHEDGHTWPQIIGRSPSLTALYLLLNRVQAHRKKRSFKYFTGETVYVANVNLPLL